MSTLNPVPKTRSVDPYAVMRPRRATAVAVMLALLVLATFTFAAIVVPGQEGQKGDWGLVDRVFLFATGAGIAWFVWRFASIKAVPDKTGILVRNLLVTRRLSWAEIVRLQFGGAAPWARLDLADADTVAVMAIQKADGAYAQSLAGRLAALVQVHSSGVEPGRPRRDLE